MFLLQAVQLVKTWLNWLKGDGRRMVLVYTPSGLGGAVAPELIHLTSPRRSGAAGWIEEGSNDRVTWMQMSYSYLESADPTKPPGVIPQLAPPKSEGDPDHNKVQPNRRWIRCSKAGEMSAELADRLRKGKMSR